MSRLQFRTIAISAVPRVAIGVVALTLSTASATAHAAKTEHDQHESSEPFGPPVPDQQPPTRTTATEPDGASAARPTPTPTPPPPIRRSMGVGSPGSPMEVDGVEFGSIDPGTDCDVACRDDVHDSVMPSAFDGCRFPHPGTGESVLDADCAFNVLRQRYQEFEDHRERGELVEEIDLGDSVVRRTETQVDCTVRDGRFAVSTTARRVRNFFGRMVPIRTGPGVEDAAREMDRWMVPHAVLDRDGTGGLGPASADDVRVDDRSLIRLELEGDGDRVSLFVNPETVLVERATGERVLPDGGRWRGQLDIEAVGPVDPFTVESVADTRRFDRPDRASRAVRDAAASRLASQPSNDDDLSPDAETEAGAGAGEIAEAEQSPGGDIGAPPFGG